MLTMQPMFVSLLYFPAKQICEGHIGLGLWVLTETSVLCECIKNPVAATKNVLQYSLNRHLMWPANSVAKRYVFMQWHLLNIILREKGTEENDLNEGKSIVQRGTDAARQVELIVKCKSLGSWTAANGGSSPVGILMEFLYLHRQQLRK